MNKTELLNEIQNVLHDIKDNKPKLEELYHFMMESIYEKTDESVEIPERYKKLVSEVANKIVDDYICYINTKTLEQESFPREMITEPELFESVTGEVVDENDFKHLTWDDYITIEPLRSYESFTIMEEFAETVEDKIFADNIFYALQHKRPFANFNNLVAHSKYRQQWFDFRKNKMQEIVYQYIIDNN